MIRKITPRNRLSFNGITEFDLFLNHATVSIVCEVLRLKIELGASFTLAVFLVGSRAELIVAVVVAREDIVSAVQLFALIKSDLLIDVVLAGLSLFPLHEQVVGRSDLIVFVILHEGCRLVQVVALEVIFKIVDLLQDHRDTVFPNDDPFHFY